MKLKVVVLLSVLILLTACSSTPSIPPTPTFDAMQQIGEGVYKLRCAQCHAITPDTVVIGPSLAGVATRAATRIPGYSAQDYIEESILQPRAFIVPGFPETMPTNFGKLLTSDELNGVVAYLMTLK